MQVFIPLPTFAGSARVLDNLRLNKQLVEGTQILRCIIEESTGWSGHPAVKAWQYHPQGLVKYCYAVAKELTEVRGFNLVKCPPKLDAWNDGSPLELPEWWYDMAIHDSHKARLLQKNYAHYSQFGWQDDIEDWQTINYQWPIWHADGMTYHNEIRGNSAIQW